MRIMRFFQARPTAHCLGLIGILAVAGGCGNSWDTVAPPAADDPRRVTQESQKASRAKVIAESREHSPPRQKKH